MSTFGSRMGFRASERVRQQPRCRRRQGCCTRSVGAAAGSALRWSLLTISVWLRGSTALPAAGQRRIHQRPLQAWRVKRPSSRSALTMRAQWPNPVQSASLKMPGHFSSVVGCGKLDERLRRRSRRPARSIGELHDPRSDIGFAGFPVEHEEEALFARLHERRDWSCRPSQYRSGSAPASAP